MPAINIAIKRPPATSIKGARLIQEPYRLLPQVAKDAYEHLTKKGHIFTQFAYTVDTLPDNRLVRKYFGHNGHDWVVVGILTGVSVGQKVRFERAT